MPVPVILDTDTDTDIGSDIDDNWALAFLLRCPQPTPTTAGCSRPACRVGSHSEPGGPEEARLP